MIKSSVLTPSSINRIAMKVEFIDDIGKGDKNVIPNKLVRLYDFDIDQAEQFKNAIADLLHGNNRILLGNLPFITAVNCSLELSISATDQGIVQIAEGVFECRLSKASYLDMIYMIQRLIDIDLDGYQWLYNVVCDIDFLFSAGGGW